MLTKPPTTLPLSRPPTIPSSINPTLPHYEHLPPETLAQILGNLSKADLVRTSRVSRHAGAMVEPILYRSPSPTETSNDTMKRPSLDGFAYTLLSADLFRGQVLRSTLGDRCQSVLLDARPYHYEWQHLVPPDYRISWHPMRVTLAPPPLPPYAHDPPSAPLIRLQQLLFHALHGFAGPIASTFRPFASFAAPTRRVVARYLLRRC